MKKALLIVFVAVVLIVCILPSAALLLGYEGENYDFYNDYDYFDEEEDCE